MARSAVTVAAELRVSAWQSTLLARPTMSEKPAADGYVMI